MLATLDNILFFHLLIYNIRNNLLHHLEIIVSEITWHMQDSQGIRPRQHGFMKGRSFMTSLIFCYEKMVQLLDKGKAVDVVHLNFGKVFDIVSQNFLLEKLSAHGSGTYTLYSLNVLSVHFLLSNIIVWQKWGWLACSFPFPPCTFWRL